MTVQTWPGVVLAWPARRHLLVDALLAMSRLTVDLSASLRLLLDVKVVGVLVDLDIEIPMELSRV
jgi:hypothetical protein